MFAHHYLGSELSPLSTEVLDGANPTRGKRRRRTSTVRPPFFSGRTILHQKQSQYNANSRGANGCARPRLSEKNTTVNLHSFRTTSTVRTSVSVSRIFRPSGKKKQRGRAFPTFVRKPKCRTLHRIVRGLGRRYIYIYIFFFSTRLSYAAIEFAKK